MVFIGSTSIWGWPKVLKLPSGPIPTDFEGKPENLLRECVIFYHTEQPSCRSWQLSQPLPLLPAKSYLYLWQHLPYYKKFWHSIPPWWVHQGQRFKTRKTKKANLSPQYTSHFWGRFEVETPTGRRTHQQIIVATDSWPTEDDTGSALFQNTVCMWSGRAGQLLVHLCIIIPPWQTMEKYTDSEPSPVTL